MLCLYYNTQWLLVYYDRSYHNRNSNCIQSSSQHERQILGQVFYHHFVHDQFKRSLKTSPFCLWLSAPSPLVPIEGL